MNRTYKVIYNRTRHLYQVVSELAKSRGKSDSLVTAATAADKHLRRAVVMALLAMSVSVPIAGIQAADGTTEPTLQEQVAQNKTDIATNKAAIEANTTNIAANKTSIETNKTAITTNKTAIDKNAVDISTNKTAIAANTANITTNKSNITANATAINTETQAREAADTVLTNKIGSLKANGNYIQKDASVSSNLSTLDTQIKSNADAISKETTDRETAVSTEQAARTNADTELGNRITGNATDITNLKNLSNITTAGETVIKKQAKQAVQVTATGNATVATTGSADDGSTLTYTINVAHDGKISGDDTNLVSGGTLYTELRPNSTGTYYYISNTNTTAQNLISLDATLNKALAALDIDMTDNSSYTSKLSKYFKVNPQMTTSSDGKTKTYAPDAAANGTNSVAIGPSAQAGEEIKDTSTSTTSVTGGTSSTAIGDSAKVNGNTSVALGSRAQVLNTTDQDGKTTAIIEGSTAIGNGAKVNGATDATAIGTSAQVNETAAGGIAFGKGAVTGEDKGTVTVGDVTGNVAAVGGENSVALGTDAKASGNTALALGKGAQVNNYTTQSGTTVTKTVNSGSTAIGSGAVVTGANDAVAFGSSAKVEGTGTNSDDSMAIGKSASVATAKDAMAIGTNASVASGADNAIALGNTAKANTSNTTAIGYNASATGAGAVAIGENTSTSTEGGISIGSGTSVSGRSIAIGYSTDGVTTGSDNTDAVAIGNGAQAYANDSISIGHQAGKGTNEGRTSGYGSLIAIGTNAGGNVKGMQNVALGSGAGSNVKSSYNVAIGSNAGSGINYAAAADSNPQDGYNISIGYEANYQSADANAKNIKESIAIGHSANAVSEATALGTGTTASGDKSMALGYNATAADTDSIALGDKANAGGGNIAIGSGSQAPAVTSYSKGYLTNSSSVNGYISVGGATSATGTTVLRRISNVADGAADQDAVTVAQLKAAYTDLAGTIKTTDNKISDTYTQSAIDSKISTVESKITASQTKYFSINPSSDTLTANVNNDGASTTGAADAMAIGPNATATSAKAVAIGNNVSASGKGSIALGTADNPATTGTVDAGKNTSANPHVTSAEGANSVAIGTSAIAQTDNSVALGTRASVYTSNVTDPATNTTVKVGQQSIAIGYEAETRNSDATSIGSGAKAYSNGSTAVGHGAFAQGADAIVLGTSSTANGASSGILGKSNTINGSNTYAVGSENNVNGNWGAVTYSGLYGSKNTVTPVADTSNSTKHGMDSLSITGNSNTISQGSYSDTVQNISILGNSNSVTGASSDAANAGTTANITVIGGNNEVTGRDGAGSDYMGKTWNQLTRTTVIGYGNKVNQAASTTSLADTQILGNDVTATLGNSVYLGTGAEAKDANSPDTDTLTKAETDAANAVDTTGMTDDQKTTALSNAKAKARYAVKLAAMKAHNGSTAGTEVLSTDTTYGDGTSYTYAGIGPVGVVTVGSAGKERRIQNVAAGLVSASSTDAVNGSQLYALTRQIRFGGDNSSFGTTTADDKNVVARGSNETLNIIGGEKDSTKLTDNNIGVVSDGKDTLTVKLSKNVNLGTDGSVVTGNATLNNSGITIFNGPKFTSNGIDTANQKITSVKAGETDTDAANVGQVKSARTLLTQGTNTTLTDTEADGHHTYTVNVNNLAVKANGTGNTTVELAKGINFQNGTNTTTTVGTDGTVTVSATHNKLSTVSAATGDKDNVTLTLTDADGNTVTSTGLKNTYTTVTKDGTSHIVTFARNDGATETLSLGDLGGITAAQDKYVTSGTVTYDANGNGTASLTGNNGLTASITGLKDTRVSSGTVNYVGTQGNASGSATLTMNDGSTATVSGLKDDYITSASVGTETNHVTMTRLGGGTVNLNLNPILEKYSLSDYHLVGAGTTHDQEYTVDSNGTVTLNVVDDKNPTGTPKTIQITGLASQSGVNAGRTTIKSSDSSVIINDGTSNSDTHTYDIKVDYSKIPSHVSLAYTGDTGNGSNTLDHAVKFAGTANQVTTTATNGQVTFALASDIKGINSVTAGSTTLNTNGVTNGNMSLTSTGLTVANTDVSKQVSLTASGVSMGSQRVQNVADAAQDTDAATLGQVKNARTKVAAGSNVAGVGSSEDTTTHQTTYTVNVDNLSVKANDGTAREVTLKTGLNFKNGNNTTAVVGDNGDVKYDLNPALTGLTSVTAGNSTLDTNGLTIKEGTATKVAITSGNVTMGGNVIHNVGAGTETTDAVNKGQLDALQNQVSGGWNLAGKNAEGTAVTAKIGAGKTMTYTDGSYTKSVVTKDDSDNATVKVDVTTGTLTVGADGKITSANGLATTGDVANAVNNASWIIQDGNKTQNAQQVKAGDIVSFKAGDNLSLDQNGKAFTYKLNKTLTDMTSVTAVDDKQNKAVLNGEGLKVSDKEDNSLTQHATEIRLHDGTKTATDTATDVVLNKQGLQNGGHTITGVADGTIGENSQDAINGSQFYKLQQTVTNGGWNITGEDTTKSTHIGNDKTVSFKNGTNTTVSVDGSDTGVDVKVDVNTTAISTDADHKAIASGNGLATASDVASAINNAAWNVKKNGGTAQQVKAGDMVVFDAGDNIVLNQNGMNFTYGLASDVNINSIRLGGTKDGKGNWAGGIYIGEQAGSGANLAKGFYITGLSNTKWDRAAISENSNMAATEGQLKQAIENITKSGDGTGGFGLMADSGAPIMQDLRKTIQVKGDGEGTADENIKTSNESGVLRIRLNKQLNLTDQGSVTIGSSQVSDGSIVLDNTNAARKITLNSQEGTVSIGGVTVNGAAKTVSGLSNTEWNVETAAKNGYKDSSRAATESQLQTVYNQATRTASENELHTLAKEGGYTVDDNHKVSMDVVNGKGEKQDSIVINDVAKASEVGTVSDIAKDLQNKAGDTLKPTSVVDAINNLNGKVDNKVGDQNYLKVEGKEIADGDSTTTAIGKLNNRMNDIYQTAGQHTTVSNTDKNLDIRPTTDEKGKTNYEINLSKQINLGDVKLDGDKGSIEAQSIKADSFTSGSTVVNNDGVQVGKGTALTSDSLKVGNKTYISSDGLNANSQKITNVQAGEADTDAANVGQVRAADEQLAAGINQNAYGIQQLDHAVNKLDSRINRVGAGAAALAALHPGSYDPEDKWDFSAAFGHYHDANAAALGIYYHPNETTILSIGGSMGDGENMVNAGITWKMGRGGHHVQPVQKSPVVSVPSSPKVQPAEPVAVSHAPQESKPVPAAMPSRLPDSEKTMDTATLARILSKQTEILEKLAQNQAAPVNRQAVSGDDIFPDVPEHHWAYVFAEKLEKAGLLKGYTGTGALTSPVLTRNDFANILYTALKNGATTNPLFNKDDSLNRMAAEFKEELKQVK